MTKFGGRRSRFMKIAGLGLALGGIVGATTPAGADEGEFTVIEGQPPQSVIDVYDDCQTPEQLGLAGYDPLFCLVVRITSGEIKIGSKVAKITSPITSSLTAANRRNDTPPVKSVTDARSVAGSPLVVSDQADFTPDMVGYAIEFPGGGDANRSIQAVVNERTVVLDGNTNVSSPTAGRAMKIFTPSQVVVSPPGAPPAEILLSGGLLGISGLDPILKLEPKNLRVLSLGATPDVGKVGAENELDFAFWVGYGGGEFAQYEDHTLSVPLAVKLNNTLLGGPNCRIPEALMRPTTGVVPNVPAGIAPMEGSIGGGMVDYYANDEDDFLNGLEPGNGYEAYVKNVKFVDNSFAVGGATGCGGPANLARNLAFLTGGNVVEKLINQQAGLPSPAGRNHVILNAALHLTNFYQDGLDPFGLIGR